MPTTNIFKMHEFEGKANAHPGHGVSDLVLATAQHQELVWAKFEPTGNYGLHSHPYEQISVMLQGRMRLTVGEEVREVGAGDLWHAPANVKHGGEILGDEPVIFIDVYSPPSGGLGQDVTWY